MADYRLRAEEPRVVWGLVLGCPLTAGGNLQFGSRLSIVGKERITYFGVVLEQLD